MSKLLHRLVLFLIVLFLSCRTRHNHEYAIRDFRDSLQPALFKAVSKGIVGFRNGPTLGNATDKELINLGNSEHPVLRALAFRQMVQRKSFDHFDILMNHLDDTAMILADQGEFGLTYRTVSDDFLSRFRWKTHEEKNRTVDAVLKSHNYLRSAYRILNEIEPQDKYYSAIRDMATHPRNVQDGYELGFDDIEYALYGLARFKKHEDLRIIAEKLTANRNRLSFESFRLMSEFPDTIYFPILQRYYNRQFYKFSGSRRGGFTGDVVDRAEPEDFIHALVAQETDRSAALLDTMLLQLPLEQCMPGKKVILDNLIGAIWASACPVYVNLRKKVKYEAERSLKGELVIHMDSSFRQSVDTTKEVITW